MTARANYLYAIVFVALASYSFYRIFSNYDKKSSSESHTAATNVLGRKNISSALIKNITIGNDKTLNTGETHDDNLDDITYSYTNNDDSTTTASYAWLRYSKGSQFLNNMDSIYNSSSSEHELLQKCLNL